MKTFKNFTKEDFKEPEVKMFHKEGTSEEDEVTVYEKGVYISVKMAEESKMQVQKYLDEYLPDADVIDIEELHCTLIYSKKKYEGEIDNKEYKIPATIKGFKKFDNGKVLVALVKSNFLENRFQELMKLYDFVYDYEDYIPHFTLSYNAEDIDILSLPPIDFAVFFEDETTAPLDTSYDGKSKNKDGSETSVTFVGQELEKEKKQTKKDDKEEEKDKK